MKVRQQCPLCETPTSGDELVGTHVLVTTAKGYDLWKCGVCGLVYGREYLDVDEQRALYGEAYAAGYDEAALVAQARAYADRFFGDRRQRRVVEVGCGNGHFLRRLRELGFTVHGVEMNAAAAARAWDLPMTVAAFEDLPDVEGAFDYVVTFHVLEHVVEPVAVAAKIARMLKAGGSWFNYMPNVGAWRPEGHGPAWIHFNPTHPREHINFFDEETLARLAVRVGLTPGPAGAASDDFWMWANKR